MMGDHQMFYGDGRASDPVPLDFLKARKVKFKGLTDEERIESVLNHLVTNSEAEVWYYALNMTKSKADEGKARSKGCIEAYNGKRS